MDCVLNSTIASHLLADSPILSLSLKITDSMKYQLSGNLKAHSLTAEQWVVLTLVHKGLADCPSELSKCMGISSPRITRLVDQLEVRNLLSRETTSEDRRKFTISLTDEGCSVATRAVKVSSILPLMDESTLTEQEKSLFNCFLEAR